MAKKLLLLSGLILILLAGSLVAAYMLTPQLSRWLISQWLEQQGFDAIEFQMQPPHGNRLIINQLQLTHLDGQRQTHLYIHQAELRYTLAELLKTAQLSSIAIDQFQISIQIDTTLPQRLQTLQQEILDLPTQQLGTFFDRLPTEQLHIAEVTLHYQADDSPALGATGTLQLNSQTLDSSWHLALDQQRLADLTLRVHRDASLSLHLTDTQHSLYQASGSLSYQEQQWQLNLGHQVFSTPLLRWLQQHFNLSYNWHPGLQDPLSFTTEFRLPRQLPLAPAALLQALTGDLTLATRLEPRWIDQPHPLALNLLAQIALQQGQLSGEFRVDNPLAPVTFRGTMTPDGKADIQWRIPETSAPELLDGLRPYLADLPPQIRLHTGRFTAAGTARIEPESWQISGQAQLADANLSHANTQIEGVNWNSRWQWDHRGHWHSTGDVQLQRLNIGLPVSLTPLNYQLEHHAQQLTLQLSAFNARLLGGQVYVPALSFDPRAPELLFLVSLRQFNLGAILELYADQGLYGEGLIDGQLPVRYNAEGLSIQGGNIGTVAPGVIRYQPNENLDAMAQGNMGLRLALDALSDLQYQLLDLDVYYQPNGDLTLRSRLQGHNPEWQQGRPIDLTLTIEDNIPDLLRALQITGRITDALGQHFQRQ